MLLTEVAAFEELVGCYGGLGRWQTRPLIVRRLGRLGHRADLEPDAVASGPRTDPVA